MHRPCKSDLGRCVSFEISTTSLSLFKKGASFIKVRNLPDGACPIRKEIINVKKTMLGIYEWIVLYVAYKMNS